MRPEVILLVTAVVAGVAIHMGGVIPTCESVCGAGYVHGVLESAAVLGEVIEDAADDDTDDGQPRGYSVGDLVYNLATLETIRDGGGGGGSGGKLVLFGSAGRVTSGESTAITVAFSSPTPETVQHATAAPEMLMHHAQWTAKLPGGFKRRDVVHTVVQHSDGVDEVRIGARGIVVGPSPVNPERFLVDFQTPKLWHVWHDTVVRESEYAYFTAVRQNPQQPRPQSAHAPKQPAMSVTVLREDPPIYLVDGFLSGEEIQEILRVGTPLLQPSKLQQFRGGQTDASLRSSSTAFLGGAGSSSSIATTGGLEWNPTLVAVQKRAAVFTSLPWTHSEAMQLVRYTQGQSFGDHTDFFPPGSTDGDRTSGQRVFTCFLYLNDGFDGGETTFPLLNLTVTPKKGSMLLWRNTLRGAAAAAAAGAGDGLGRGSGAAGVPASSVVDGRTLHRGNPVLKGVKYAANLWVVERPFELYRTTLL